MSDVSADNDRQDKDNLTMMGMLANLQRQRDDLLAELDDLVSFLAEVHNKTSGSLTQARAAIAKARGQLASGGP